MTDPETRHPRARGWLILVAGAAVGFYAGRASRPPQRDRQALEESSARAGVTGLGGVFLKSEDPAAMLAWYRAHLGIESEDWGGFPFKWIDLREPEEIGYTIWSLFPDSTGYFAPSEDPVMVNFRVQALDELLGALRTAGVPIVGETEEHPNGRFAWILDPEGRKIELWEPVPAARDPYLGTAEP